MFLAGQLPAFAEKGVELFTKLDRQFTGFACFVKGDGFPDVIDDDLAWIASGHVSFELIAEGRIQRSIDVFVQQPQQILAFHSQYLNFIEP